MVSSVGRGQLARGVVWPALLACFSLGACGSSDERPSARALGTTGGGAVATSGAGDAGTNGTTTGGIPPVVEPEREVESSFRAPVATGKYLFSANPESGRVAIIDTQAVDIRIADAGFGPTYLAAVPTDDAEESAAIVINVLGHDATLLRVTDGAEVRSETFPIHVGANSWAVADSGDWAVAWTDATQIESPDPTDGFQDISLVHIDTGAVTRLSVGYRPSQVVYDAEEARLFVVTEPGISVIDLTSEQPETTDFIGFDDASGFAVVARDVSITRDGRLALVRTHGADSVVVLPLDGAEPIELAMTGEVTDLDLSRDGLRAVAVMRAQSDVAILDVANISEPDAITMLHIEGGIFGSVALSPDAEVAVLYTNALKSPLATILSLQEGDALSHRTVDLKGPVQAVFVAADGEHAIAILDVPEGATKAGAFSVLVTKAERAPKIVGTDAPTFQVALAPGLPSMSAVVTTRDDAGGVFAAHVVTLPNLQVDSFALASPPLATGILSERPLAYVAQAHPEGRITFLDLLELEAQTLTGYELATKVVD